VTGVVYGSPSMHNDMSKTTDTDVVRFVERYA